MWQLNDTHRKFNDLIAQRRLFELTVYSKLLIMHLYSSIFLVLIQTIGYHVQGQDGN